MVGFLEALLLGLVQGITEWLPISSSGHLALLEYYFGIEQPLLYVAVLHMASLIALLLLFRKRIVQIITSFFSSPLSGDKNLVWFIVLATLPSALIGYFFFDFFESLFTSMLITGVSFILNGFILFLAELRQGRREFTFSNTFVIGIAQVFSIIPAISRSGITITAGTLQGIDKIEAATFSFLLAIPVVFGASLFSFFHVEWTENLLFLGVSALVTFVTSYYSLRFLLNFIQKNKLYWFGLYSAALGLIIVF